MGAGLLNDPQVTLARGAGGAPAPPAAPETTTSLPADMLTQTAKRVWLAAMTIAAGWAFVIVANTIVMRALPNERMGLEAWPMPGYLLAFVGLTASLLMAWYARSGRDTPEHLLDLGLLFEIVTGALIAIQTQWVPSVVPMRVSWLCVLVVLYPAIVPHTPGRTLLASLITVSMDPLLFWIANLRGAAGDFRGVELVWMFVPNYTCALLATVPAKIIRKLSAQVKKARELGNYRIGNLLASGGMGDVYRAQHQLLVRPAAIKLIRPDLIGHGDQRRVALERFKREAQAAALLESPHTIALYDFGTTNEGTFYYAMELLDGPSFEQLVERFGPVPAPRAINLMRQACESIAEAHARGLIHRDIKPSNLVAARLGLQVDFVKVLDFGLVKFDPRTAPQSAMLTAPEIATGSPAFMAPEAALGDRTADHRIDIYSLGCVLYWLLTGRLVFDGDTPQRVMVQHVSEVPVPPSQRTELPVPPGLDAIVMACLAKKPDERPSSALELSRLLNEVPVDERWSSELARHWWDQHLPDDGHTHDERCDHGIVVPQESSS